MGTNEIADTINESITAYKNLPLSTKATWIKKNQIFKHVLMVLKV